MRQKSFVHPYMPNSTPHHLEEMLNALNAECIEDIYRDLIPDELRFKGELDLPEPIMSEWELKKHVMGLLNENVSCAEVSSFLGAGCYRHYVPAVCDEIANRAEFLTAYCGDTYSDHGKMQAIFEYASMMGELLDTDVVSYPMYDGSQAVCSSVRMALRIGGKGRNEVIVPSTMNPSTLSQLKEYCRNFGKIIAVNADESGRIDLGDLSAKLSNKTAAVYFENPSYLGFFEEKGEEIAAMAHDAGALVIVSPEVMTLGVIESPANYGADILCGEVQPLGVHMQYGGGCAGFIAMQNDEKLVSSLPTYLYGLLTTQNEGEYGWGRALNYRCSHGSRENANEYFGTESGLWAIVAGVYLASMGPQGMREIGETILQKTAYAIDKLSEVDAISVHPFGGSVFQEFVVNFDKCQMTVREVNKALLKKGIFGGKDLSKDFPQYGQSALYCIGEMTSADEIDRLAAALSEITGGDK